MKSAKTEFKYLPFFDNNNSQFQLQPEKMSPQRKTQPAFVQTDGGSAIAKKKCQLHPLRILRPVVKLALSMTLFNDKKNLAIQVVETKKRISQSQCELVVMSSIKL